MKVRRAIDATAHNTFDELAVTYGQLLLVRDRSSERWPPGKGHTKPGPTAPISAALLDLIADYEDMMRAGGRLLRRAESFIDPKGGV